MERKKILVLSTGDVNGAYEAMYKVSELLIELGCEVVMLVKNKTKNDAFIKKYSSVDVLPSMFSRIMNKALSYLPIRRKEQQILKTNPKYSFISNDEFSENIVVDRLLACVGFKPDFIFTGMTTGFINSTDLLNIYKVTKADIYNITVDMNHFTGGCHFSWGCQGYVNGCGSDCPAILNNEFKYLAQENFNLKFENAQKGNFKIIAGSGLTLEQAKQSKIYYNQDPIFNINSLIDTKLLNSSNRNIAKQVFGFDKDKFYIMCGSQNMKDPRKGFKYFIEALEILEQTLEEKFIDSVVIVVVSNEVDESFHTNGFEKVKVDYIKDYRLLALLYQACDLFVNSSIEDSGPMMVSEALACGTPVVGFDTGILINMIDNGKNGYKVPIKDTKRLADAIDKIINLNTVEYKLYSEYAERMVRDYSSYEYAKDIFSKIIN